MGMNRADKQPRNVIPQFMPMPTDRISKVSWLGFEGPCGDFRLTIEHVGCEQGEDGTANGSQEGVCSHGRSGEHEIRIDDVVQATQEDCVDAEPQEQTSKRGNDPGDTIRKACPAKPKKADREDDTTNLG